MPCTRGFALRPRISSASACSDTSAPGSWWNDSMPTSALSLRFMRTYTSEAGSSPTRIVARPGAHAVRVGQLLDLRGHALAQASRDRVAVDDLRVSHAS